jgi:hypothetical protein
VGCCKRTVADTGRQFGNPEEGELLLLEAVTRRLVKSSLCAPANCKFSTLVKMVYEYLLVFTDI